MVRRRVPHGLRGPKPERVFLSSDEKRAKQSASHLLIPNVPCTKALHHKMLTTVQRPVAAKETR